MGNNIKENAHLNLTKMSTPEEDDNSYYLASLKNNDFKGIEKIYKEFSPMIIKYVCNNSGNQQEARDVFQDALLVIYEKLKKGNFKLSASFKTYLFSVCRFIWLKKLKKSQKMVITDKFENTLIDESQIEEVLLQARKMKLYRKNLSALSNECQELLKYSFDGKSGKEIAGIMNYSVEYVKRKKFRCKNALTRAIKNDPEYYDLIK